MTKDYSIDLQHLVLLHGFQLQGKGNRVVDRWMICDFVFFLRISVISE